MKILLGGSFKCKNLPNFNCNTEKFHNYHHTNVQLTYSSSLLKIYYCISVFMHNITLTKKGIRLFSCLIRYHVGLHMLPVQMLTVRGFSIQYSNYVTFTYLVYLWDIQKPCTYILTYVDLCKYFSKMLRNLKNRFLHSSFNVKVTQLSKTHQFSMFDILRDHP